MSPASGARFRTVRLWDRYEVLWSSYRLSVRRHPDPWRLGWLSVFLLRFAIHRLLWYLDRSTLAQDTSLSFFSLSVSRYSVSTFTLPDHSLPAAYRKRLRTSTGIERLNEELRRRERVIRIFPNEASMIRLMGAVLMEHHEKWSSVKKYFTMDCYFAEREEARKTALAERIKRVHTIY